MRAARPQINDALGKPKPRKTAYRTGPVLDQGNTPQCVGYSARSFLDAAPIMSKPNEGPAPTVIYNGAQANDEWPGNNYDGSSVRGGMKFLSGLGEVKSYVWGQTVEEACKWMNDGYGTCLVGTDWYAEMSDVDANGFMREPASSMSTPIGGHAWHWIWYDAKKKAILMKNSWGNEFGIMKRGVMTGFAYLSLGLAARLLKADGEIAAPVQVKISATTV
jgi:hypothetical protein